MVLEKTLESPFYSKEIKPVNPKGNQSWIFTGRTDAEVEVQIVWPLDVKNWLLRKDPDAGKDWRQDEKGITEDEVVGWHHLLNGHEIEQMPGDGEGKGNLECYSPWGHKESKTTEPMKNNTTTVGKNSCQQHSKIIQSTHTYIYIYVCVCVCVCVCRYAYIYFYTYTH